MNTLFRVLSLALFWAAMTGSFSLWTLASGVALGGLVIWFMQPLYADADVQLLRLPTVQSVPGQLMHVWWLVELIGFFGYELVRSSVQVAVQVLRPRLRVTPGIIALDLDARSDLEITALANLISLTPGTLSLDVDRERERLYVHSMFVGDEEAAEARAYIKRTLEKRVIRALGATKGPG